MRVWSIQPVEIAERVEAGERFLCDPELAVCYNLDDSFQQAYRWLVGEMGQRIPRPEDVQLPIWAWHRSYGKQVKPDRRRSLFREYGKENAILELGIPDELVLLTDFEDWHAVLNNCPIITDEEYEADPDREFSRQETEMTWQQLFSVDDKEFVQACFWSIEPEQLIRVHRIG